MRQRVEKADTLSAPIKQAVLSDFADNLSPIGPSSDGADR